MKSDEELFKEVYDECKEAIDIEEFDVSKFIENCEYVYKMNSDEFKKWYEENDYEGNVDHQLWYMFIK